MKKTFTLTTPHREYKHCGFYTAKYQNNGALFIGIAQKSALGLRSEPLMDVTVNLDAPPPEGCIYVKSYSENDGLLEALQTMGLITEVLYGMPSGYVMIPACRYDPDVLASFMC